MHKKLPWFDLGVFQGEREIQEGGSTHSKQFQRNCLAKSRYFKYKAAKSKTPSQKWDFSEQINIYEIFKGIVLRELNAANIKINSLPIHLENKQRHYSPNIHKYSRQ